MSGPETGYPLAVGPTLAELSADAAEIIESHDAASGNLACCHTPGVCGLWVWARRMRPSTGSRSGADATENP